MLNEILLRRKHKVTVDLKTPLNKIAVESLTHLFTFELNLSSLGFSLEQNLALVLAKQPVAIIDDLYKELIPALKALIGADKEYIVMYPNFPKQVAEADDAELWINAILHYASFGTWLPEYEKVEGAPLAELSKRQELTLGSLKDLKEIFTNLLSSKTSLAQQDYKDLEWCLENVEESWNWIPEEITFKEILAWISAKLVEEGKIKVLAKYYKTAIDVLRLAASLSDGDVSLVKNTKFKSFSRKERRIIMSLLTQCSNLNEDMWRYKEQWIRLGERLHPGEFKGQAFKKVQSAFKSIREEKKPLFWTGKVEGLIKSPKHNKDEMEMLLGLLTQRPGEFARRLDKLLRDYPDYTDEIVESFSTVADKVSTPVLLQTLAHFQYRNCEDLRTVMPKGNVAKIQTLDSFSQEIGDTTKLRVVIINALVQQYSKRSTLGNVWIDDELKNFIIPFSQRSATSTYKSMTRGSRFTLAQKNVRFFIWWTNVKDKFEAVDLDLSVAFYNENWGHVGHVSYDNIRDNIRECYHSGDITNGGAFGGKGASEFIDVDLDAMLNGGVRYVIPQVHSYTGEPFSQVPCTFGWMGRSDLNSGEIYEPTTVENQISLSSEGRYTVPLVIDCKERKVVWTDLSGQFQFAQFNNLESNLVGTTLAAYAMVNLKRTTMFQVAALNALARGKVVERVEDADVIFTTDKEGIKKALAKSSTALAQESKAKSEEPRIITQWDLDVFMSDLI